MFSLPNSSVFGRRRFHRRSRALWLPPRTLLALGRDPVIPRFLAKSFGARNEPPLALIIIAETSRLSEFCFLGIAVKPLDGKEDPLGAYAQVEERVRGNLVLAKSWHDLEL